MTFVGRLFSGVLLGMALVARVLLASAVLFWADSVLSLSLGLPCCHNAPRQFLAAARVAPVRRSLADARVGLAYSRRRQLLTLALIVLFSFEVLLTHCYGLLGDVVSCGSAVVAVAQYV